jgi:hypothetical protein
VSRIRNGRRHRARRYRVGDGRAIVDYEADDFHDVVNINVVAPLLAVAEQDDRFPRLAWPRTSF